MKILLVSTASPEYRAAGGIVSHLALLKRHLLRQSHRVHSLVAARPTTTGGLPRDDLTEVGPSLVDGVPIRYHANLLAAYSRLRSSFSPDVIHIHSQSGAAIAVKEREIPVVTTLHAAEAPTVAVDECCLTRTFRATEREVKRRQVTEIVTHSDRLFVPSSKAVRDLVEFCPRLASRPLHVLPAGVDLDRFRPLERNVLKTRFGFHGRFVVLSVGRITHKKGVGDLLRAAPSVLAAIPDAFFVIIGAGPAEQILKRQAAELQLADRVSFVGPIPNRDLPAYYNAADVFVNPTQENETFGLTTIEAMACGLPVIVSRSGADTGVVTLSHARIFSGIEDLARSLIALHADAGLRSKLAAGGRDWALQFSFDLVGDQLVRCYEDLVRVGKSATIATSSMRWTSFWCTSLADGMIRWPRRLRRILSAHGRGQIG